MFDDVVAILQDAKDQNQIKDVALDQLAFMLIGGILLYFSVNPSLPKETDLDQLADDYTRLMFMMLLDGVAVNKS